MAKAQRLLECGHDGQTTMWLILLEAGLALGLLLFIVWWTMFAKPKRKPPKE